MCTSTDYYDTVVSTTKGHTMWVNLHTLPANEHMFTVAYTEAPVDTLESDRWIEEEDIVAPARATVADVIAAVRAMWAADGLTGAGLRFVGVSDQSDGYVMQQNWEGIL